MRVAIDISPLHQYNHHRGIGTYARNLAESLREVGADHQFDLIKSTRSLNEYDLVHYPFFDLFFLTLPFSKPKPTIVTIHDVIPLVYPDKYLPGIRGKIKHRLQKLSLGNVKHIITDSQTSKKDIIEYLSVDPHMINSIPLAPGKEFFPRNKKDVKAVLSNYEITQPYLLYVGDINYNKNLVALVKAFGEVDPDCNLVLVSRALTTDIPESRQIRRAIKKTRHPERVKVLTDVGDELSALYSGAEWYIQPSLYEGFGLPVLEAMACKAPVISSIGGSLREIVNDQVAVTFDPLKPESMAWAIDHALLLSNKSRQKYATKGHEHAQGYSWKKTANKTLEIYSRYITV